MAYTFLFISILFFYSFDQKPNKHTYLYFIGLIIVLMEGLRHYTIGTDTSGYVEDFLYLQTNSPTFSEIFSQNEPLFYAFTKILSQLTNSYTIYLLLVSVFYNSILCSFIKKYSADYRLSFIIFISLGIFFFNMAGIRQTIAMGFLLLSLMSLLDRKLIHSLFWYLIACGFHITSVVYGVVYLIKIIPISPLFLIFFVILLVFSFTSGVDYALRAASWIWSDTKGYEESDGGISMFLILLVFTIFALITNWKKIRNYHKHKTYNNSHHIIDREIQSTEFFIKLLMCSLVFQAIGTKQADMFRITYLFDVVCIVLIPNCISLFKDRILRKSIYWTIIILALIRLYILVLPNMPDVYPFRFFWS